MKYSVSYHAHCKMTLNCGRDIILTSLHQSLTYAGWLEGVPRSEDTQWILSDLLESAKERYKREPVLLEPERRFYLRERGDMIDHDCPKRGPAEWLPMISCSGLFRSVRPVQASSGGSVLLVVWLQPEYGPPLGDVLQKILALNWDGKAVDVSY